MKQEPQQTVETIQLVQRKGNRIIKNESYALNTFADMLFTEQDVFYAESEFASKKKPSLIDRVFKTKAYVQYMNAKDIYESYIILRKVCLEHVPKRIRTMISWDHVGKSPRKNSKR